MCERNTLKNNKTTRALAQATKQCAKRIAARCAAQGGQTPAELEHSPIQRRPMRYMRWPTNDASRLGTAWKTEEAFDNVKYSQLCEDGAIRLQAYRVAQTQAPPHRRKKQLQNEATTRTDAEQRMSVVMMAAEFMEQAPTLATTGRNSCANAGAVAVQHSVQSLRARGALAARHNAPSKHRRVRCAERSAHTDVSHATTDRKAGRNMQRPSGR